MIYFLIVNYYSTHFVTKLISSLTSTELEYQVIIINNSPQDASIFQLACASVRIFNATTNLGFGSACNEGLNIIYAEAPEAIAWVINPDAYLLENTLAQVQPFFNSHPEVSILGTIVYTPAKKVWFAGGRFNDINGEIISEDLLTNLERDYVACHWVTGCSLIINLSNFPECPQFDPIYFLYYEDFDFCLRYAHQGHLIAVTKQFGVVHQPSSITNKYVFRKTKHSTYSYLLTLDKYTNKLVLIIRLMRLICYAFILILVKPRVAFGKLSGILLYWHSRNFIKRCWE
ncbi:glycosyltransferase [Iningainema tapete]|uniref:Glycosyltransferase family 2 protein n=1 Tax=Iningainema tapete BLCC-T55 TaxID=2748662 RepID=A0A8J7BW37_9CYAN|nr:glycosyltransferase family 2 protein [Iningainema tapete BLCC-T55]